MLSHQLWPIGHAAANTAQYAVSLYHSQGTLLAHVLLAEPKPLVLFSSTATLVVNLAMDQNVAASCHINNAYLLIWYKCMSVTAHVMRIGHIHSQMFRPSISYEVAKTSTLVLCWSHMLLCHQTLVHFITKIQVSCTQERESALWAKCLDATKLIQVHLFHNSLFLLSVLFSPL